MRAGQLLWRDTDLSNPNPIIADVKVDYYYLVRANIALQVYQMTMLTET